MKVTKAKSAENRAALVRAASKLIRERGFDGVGVADICESAGLTHGALYRQFPSKDALAAAAMRAALDESHEDLVEEVGDLPAQANGIVDYLLSPDQRDSIERSCPMTASASGASRLNVDVSEVFADGFSRLVDTIEGTIAREYGSDPNDRQRAITIVAAEIGAIAVSRAVNKARPTLSDEILRATRAMLALLAGGTRAPR